MRSTEPKNPTQRKDFYQKIKIRNPNKKVRYVTTSPSLQARCLYSHYTALGCQQTHHFVRTAGARVFSPSRQLPYLGYIMMGILLFRVPSWFPFGGLTGLSCSFGICGFCCVRGFKDIGSGLGSSKLRNSCVSSERLLNNSRMVFIDRETYGVHTRCLIRAPYRGFHPFGVDSESPFEEAREF